MTTLREAIDDEIREDPSFATLMKIADAEIHLGEALARARELQGLSQAELGKRAGFAQSAIARYERAGRTPGVDSIWRLADALNVRLEFGPGYSIAVCEQAGICSGVSTGNHAAFSFSADASRHDIDS